MGSHNLLGIVEGFYGKPWGMKARLDYIYFMKKARFNFYLYAPKSDIYLRDKWQCGFLREHKDNLECLSREYRRNGLSFGIGFSPMGLSKGFSYRNKCKLRRKIKELNDLDLDVLSIQFDDINVREITGLAKKQVEILNYVLDYSTTKRVLFCPTFYSYSKSLERLFGDRPEGYFEYLNKNIPESVDIIWAGPNVCSKEINSDHLKEVKNLLGRKPFIWDNYLANDGLKGCNFINIGPVSQRSPDLKELTAGYVSNPMNQPYLSQIPLLTIRDFYFNGKMYSEKISFINSVKTVMGEYFLDFANEIIENLQKKGLTKMSDEDKRRFADIFYPINSPWAREIVEWLNGGYIVDNRVFNNNSLNQ